VSECECACLCMNLRESVRLLYFESMCACLMSVWAFVCLFVWVAGCGVRLWWVCVVFVACVAVVFVW